MNRHPLQLRKRANYSQLRGMEILGTRPGEAFIFEKTSDRCASMDVQARD